MPLSAKVNGEPVISSLLPQVRWEQVRELAASSPEAVIVTCCGKQAYPREAPGVVRHFVHREHDPECPYRPEDPVQLWAKTEIAKGCLDAGYEPMTDVWGSDWCTDVLAMKQGAKAPIAVAFQVQWKRLTLKKALDRQQQYEQDKVRACWLFKRFPARYSPRRDLPAFELTQEGESAVVRVGNMTYPVRSWTSDLLSRRIRFCEVARGRPEQPVEIVIFESPCWKCGLLSVVYDVFPFENSWTTSDCGESVECRELVTNIFAPELLSLVSKHLDENPTLGRLAAIRQHRDRRYGLCTLFFCECGKAYPLGLNTRSPHSARPDVILASIEGRVSLVKSPSEPMRHWCYPQSGAFCDG